MPRNYLLFRLAGPLASWGEIAVGEWRSTWPRPSKSAILGLVAAALGLRRQNHAAHAALQTGLAFAVRMDRPVSSSEQRQTADRGMSSLCDFHTAQFPPQASVGKLSPDATRADHLAAFNATRKKDPKKANSILSRRWYWSGMAATVALWQTDHDDAPPLDAIQNALLEPVFTLYLGRKCCPPGQPLRPRILATGTLADAFQAYDLHIEACRRALFDDDDDRGLRPAFAQAAVAPGGEIWADPDGIPEDEWLEVAQRRDAPASRTAWTFFDRTEIRIPSGDQDDVSLPR